jgi:hypothetical protein
MYGATRQQVEDARRILLYITQHTDFKRGMLLVVFRRISSLALFVLGVVLEITGSCALIKLIDTAAKTSDIFSILASCCLHFVDTTQPFRGSDGGTRIVYGARVVRTGELLPCAVSSPPAASTAAAAAAAPTATTTTASTATTTTATAAAAAPPPPPTAAVAAAAAAAADEAPTKVGKSSYKDVHGRYSSEAKLYAGMREKALELGQGNWVVQLCAVLESTQLVWKKGQPGERYANRLMEAMEALVTMCCSPRGIIELTGGAPAYGDARHFTHEARVWCGECSTYLSAVYIR